MTDNAEPSASWILNLGDEVQHKSRRSRPNRCMIVIGISDNDQNVECEWTDEKGIPRTEFFRSILLSSMNLLDLEW